MSKMNVPFFSVARQSQDFGNLALHACSAGRFCVSEDRQQQVSARAKRD